MICQDVIAVLEKLSNRKYACNWDNVGLLVGHKEQKVNKILIALDATLETVQQAVDKNADMLITHHPMIFHKINRVTDSDPCGRKILQLAENHIAYYAMHTNFDVMGGMAQLAEKKLELSDAVPLEVTWTEGNEEGIGRVGKLPAKISVAQCAQQIKRIFQIPQVMVYGDQNRMIERVAVCPGSGKSMVLPAIEKGAQVLISGDFGHHEGMDAWEMGLPVIDATHYGLEHMFTEYVKQYLQKQFNDQIEVDVFDSKCPFEFV